MEDKEYILTASELENNSSLFIPVETKKEQQKLFTRLCHLATSYTKDVDQSISLSVIKTFQEKKLWIKIEKKASPSTLYIKTPEGEIKPLKLRG